MQRKRFFLLPFLLLFLELAYSAAIPVNSESTDPFVVVLDAGHGGHDPGNLGNGYLEKNIALNIVLKVGAWLEQNSDIKVVYTRKDDSFVDLYVRGEIANKANADLFVSVHCDSHSSDAHGAGTFVLGLHANEQNFEIAKKENSVIYLEDNYESRYAEYDINSPESIIGLTIMQEEFLDRSILLAKMMQDNFTGKLKRNDRKVKQAGFIVLHQTFMPSVLVETGFLTNKNEGSYLNSTKGQQEMGRAIAEAILTYKNNLAGSIADFPETSPEPPAGNSTAADKAVAVKEKARENLEKMPEKEIVSKAGDSNKPTSKDLAVLSSEEVTAAEVTTAVTRPKPNIIFKVQLMATSKNIALEPRNFKGLGELSREPVKNLYRYFYGNTDSYSHAKMLKSNADLKGYTTSFIVAYKDGVRISVPEALKTLQD